MKKTQPNHTCSICGKTAPCTEVVLAAPQYVCDACGHARGKTPRRTWLFVILWNVLLIAGLVANVMATPLSALFVCAVIVVFVGWLGAAICGVRLVTSAGYKGAASFGMMLVQFLPVYGVLFLLRAAKRINRYTRATTALEAKQAEAYHAAEEVKQAVVDQSKLRQLVDELAHCCSLTLDRTEENRLEAAILAYGKAAVDAIVPYLMACSYGGQAQGWWNGAAQLTRMIGKIPDVDAQKYYKLLVDTNSKIWEYHTQIRDVAQQELLTLKKQDPAYQTGVIPAEDAEAELKRVYNLYDAEARLKEAVAMQPSVDRWKDSDKAFYYYIIGHALGARNALDLRRYAFYAAQLFHQPASTSLGWYEFKNLDEYETLDPSAENAKMLHEKYPLPASFDSLLTE